MALKYKDLLVVVESLLRNMKSVLDIRPSYHNCDETIRGYASRSFLALVLMKELQFGLEARGWKLEWSRMTGDLNELQVLTLEADQKSSTLQTPPQGYAEKTIQVVPSP